MDDVFIFDFIMNYVNSQYSSDKEVADDNFSAIIIDFRNQLNNLFNNNNDFIKLLQSLYIPDVYSENGSKEKLYTKLVEVVVAIWAEKMGYSSEVLTQKSGIEDVRFTLNKTTIVCDVKTYRLGRSQAAPNVKDFLQLESVRSWIFNCSIENKENNVIGGLVTYTSSHEWARQSDVYIQCSSKETPVVMLPYEILALFLNFKDQINPEKIFELWDYKSIFPNKLPATNNKALYWDAIFKKILSIFDNVKKDTVLEFLNEQKKLQYKVIHHYLKNIDNEIKLQIENIENEINSISSINTLRDMLKYSKIKITTNEFEKYKNNIIKFRMKK